MKVFFLLIICVFGIDGYKVEEETENAKEIAGYQHQDDFDDHNDEEIDDFDANIGNGKDANTDEFIHDDNDGAMETNNVLSNQDAKPWSRRRRRRRSTRRRRRWLSTRRRCSNAISRRRSQYCYVQHNGCGGEGWLNFLPILYRETFKMECNKHDICYYCGKKWSWSQKSCDAKFKSDMNKRCSCKYNTALKAPLKALCYAHALKMYAAVKLAGKYWYSKKPPAWCSNSCVKQRGSPSAPL